MNTNKRMPIIHNTLDYSQFDFAPGNRPTTERPDLRRSMLTLGFLPWMPLVCFEKNGKKLIKDGQHRYCAARSLGLPIFYILVSNEDGNIEEIEIAEMERMHKGWKLTDSVSERAERGNNDYQILRNYCKRTGIGIRAAASMMLGSVAEAPHATRKVKDGTFRILRMDIAEAVARIKLATDAHAKWAAHQSYLGALSRCVQVTEFPVDEYIKAMNRNPVMLLNCHTITDFIAMIDRILNYRRARNAKFPIRYLVEDVVALAKTQRPSQE